MSIEIAPSAAAAVGGAVFLMKKWGKRGWDDVGSVPYENGKMIVGRGDHTPPPMTNAVSKNVIPRSEATWESVSPMWECGVRVLRIATPVCGLVRNDSDFGNRVRRVTSGGVRGANRAPPVAEEAR